ncbi:MAG: PEP/pyruvate-binding domain-containing protein [Bacillota bacterium]
MRGFQRASTGIAGLDAILDELRMGDNVVWQVSSIEDYASFVKSFVRQAVAEGRRVVYMRFGQHPEVIDRTGVQVCRLDPGQGFEAFLSEVQAIVSQEGPGTFYVFDSLSDLLSVWATDLMIGNFFRVICPFLYELDTIAYFAVLRGRNSYQTIARIRETTQLLLDLYRSNNRYYLHPLKVFNRYSPTMFLPHVLVNDEFLPITSSVETARLFSGVQRLGPGDTERKLDYWDRVFIKAQELQDRLEAGEQVLEFELNEMIDQLCRMVIGREERMLTLAKRYLSLRDLLDIRHRMIGTGFIGGKTLGMLLARAILRADTATDWRPWLEPHDSFYVGSDVFYTYLVENKCWNLRLEQKQEEGYYAVAPELRQRIMDGALPEPVREQFVHMVEYFGQAPIIVRSSSLLEDSFGNAFAGKYESVFCVNQGSPQERYRLLEEAIKTVYASTMNDDALAYRWQRGLAQSDEQMSLLIQRVSGSHRGHYFFPDLAGVALSQNPYPWRECMDPGAGMVRLVAGLGTRAVDRVEDDYPRVIALDYPLLRPDSDPEDVRRFSQRKVDLLDTVLNDWDSIPLSKLSGIKKYLIHWDLLAVKDQETTRRMKELGYQQIEAWTLTFERLLQETPFPHLMRHLLRTLESAYEYPVDIEFTANFCSGGCLEINLLQCRPFQLGSRHGASPGAPSLIPQEFVLFTTRGGFMGSDFSISPETVIYIEPEGYIKLPVTDKYQVARIIGRLNQKLGHGSGGIVLAGPGRWGTSTPSLGVPVTFAEICNASVLIEVASPKEGYMPELSFGTHFFQDLVESGLIYVALFPGKEGVLFNPGLLGTYPNQLPRLLPGHARWEKVIKVVSLEKQGLCFNVDWNSRKLVGYIKNASWGQTP